jgi:hypothetical protein
LNKVKDVMKVHTVFLIKWVSELNTFYIPLHITLLRSTCQSLFFSTHLPIEYKTIHFVSLLLNISLLSLAMYFCWKIQVASGSRKRLTAFLPALHILCKCYTNIVSAQKRIWDFSEFSNVLKEGRLITFLPVLFTLFSFLWPGIQ